MTRRCFRFITTYMTEKSQVTETAEQVSAEATQVSDAELGTAELDKLSGGLLSVGAHKDCGTGDSGTLGCGG